MFIISTQTDFSLNRSVYLNMLNVPCIMIVIQKTVPLAPRRGFPVFPQVTLRAVRVS